MNWQRVGWSVDVENCLSGALSDEGMAIVAGEVSSGVSTLWHVESHGYFITRLELFENKKELVLVAWQGKNTEPLVEYLKAACVSEGINSMRFHTVISEKLATRFVKKMCFEPVETVYRWSNKDG